MVGENFYVLAKIFFTALFAWFLKFRLTKITFSKVFFVELLPDVLIHHGLKTA